MSHRCVHLIDTRDFGSETLRVGDLNMDGFPELLFVQSERGTRAITCLTATNLAGDVLWQSGEPSRENGVIYSDLPVQIYDWDDDGHNEVLWVEQAEYLEPVLTGGWARERARRYSGQAMLHVLSGVDGREKASLALPAPADDSVAFANLTGGERRADLVVKDRYWNAWGVAHDGKPLWHWSGSTGHFPCLVDVDADGRDEVFFGYALIDHDGRVLWSHPSDGAHQDAVCAASQDGELRLFFGNGGVHCLTPDGREIWHHPVAEAQHVVAGCFRPDLGPVQIAVVERGQRNGDGRDPAAVSLFDWDGRPIWRTVQPTGSHYAAARSIRWQSAEGPDSLLIYSRGQRTPAIMDGHGNITDEFPLVLADGRPMEGGTSEQGATAYAMSADVLGDGREEAIFFAKEGCCIFTNTRPQAVPKLVNTNFYQGL